jgi:NADH:ubiquinone oxidoreductase subunit E
MARSFENSLSPLFGDLKGGMDAQLKKVLDGQKRTVTVLSSLIAVQLALGYLTPESIPGVAEHTGASVNEVYGVATFYTHFRFEPPGEHTVEVCWGPTCQLFDSQGLMKLVEEATGTTFDSTSDDRRYTLRGQECAGACALAPVGKLDGKLIGRLTPEKLQEALTAMSAGNGRSGGKEQ